MKSILRTAFAALALCAAFLVPTAAGSAATPHHADGLSALNAGTTTATPTDSASPAGPVDPGTGETPAAKETRVDFAPYVLAAVLILAVAAAALAWRRWGGPSSKPARHGDQTTDKQ
ncbi:hypothetical protein PJ267_17660 [Arthrobacter sp. OVS8]|nr:hypothetical protein PJ267_17660 [Arthrobacter sp. OVS8]